MRCFVGYVIIILRGPVDIKKKKKKKKKKEKKKREADLILWNKCGTRPIAYS